MNQDRIYNLLLGQLNPTDGEISTEPKQYITNIKGATLYDESRVQFKDSHSFAARKRFMTLHKDWLSLILFNLTPSLCPLWYQVIGVENAVVATNTNLGCAILAHEMGLGKTITGILTMKVLLMLNTTAKIGFIIVPNNMAMQWIGEINRWMPSWSVVQADTTTIGASVSDTLRESTIKAVAADNFKIVVTTYHALVGSTFREFVAHAPGNTVCGIICDESHEICSGTDGLKTAKGAKQKEYAMLRHVSSGKCKNTKETWRCILTKNMRTPETTPLILMSGTPIIDNIMQGIDQTKRVIGANSSMEWKVLVPDIMDVRKKEGTIQLTKLTMTPVYFNVSEHQAKVYFHYIQKAAAEFALQATKKRKTKGSKKIAILYGMAQRALISMETLNEVEQSKFVEDKDPGPSVCQNVLDIINSEIDDKTPFIIISEWISVLKFVFIALYDSGIKKHNMLVYTGDYSSTERVRILRRFNNQKHTTTALFMTRACATGLNLMRSHRMIEITACAQVVKTEQSRARIHRYGQKLPVTIYSLFAKIPNSISIKQNTLMDAYEKVRALRHEEMKTYIPNGIIEIPCNEDWEYKKISEALAETAKPLAEVKDILISDTAPIKDTYEDEEDNDDNYSDLPSVAGDVSPTAVADGDDNDDEEKEDAEPTRSVGRKKWRPWVPK